MALNQNGKRPVETILVAKDNQDLINNLAGGGALPGGGTYVGGTDLPLMSTVNQGFVNLNDGQLGIFSADYDGLRTNNVALQSGDDYADVPAIKIVQGTATSQNPSATNTPPLTNRQLEESGVILGRHTVTWTAKAAALPVFSTWKVGDDVGNIGEINISSNTEYRLRIAFSGTIIDYHYGKQQYPSSTTNYVTPNYLTLGLVNNLDHFVQNFVVQANRNSRQFRQSLNNRRANDPYVAFAIAPLAVGGTQDITAPAFDNGGIVNVMVFGAVTQSINLTAGQVASLRTAISAGYGILPTDLSTAGSAAGAEYMIYMALDRDRVYDDRIKNDKIDIEAGSPAGFDEQVLIERQTNAYEGEGSGRIWQLVYEGTAGQRKYAQFQRRKWPFIEVPSGIDVNERYTAFILEHRAVHELGIASASVAPRKTIILVPSCDNVTIDALEAYLNTWVRSTPSNRVIGEKDGSGNIDLTTPTYCP